MKWLRRFQTKQKQRASQTTKKQVSKPTAAFEKFFKCKRVSIEYRRRDVKREGDLTEDELHQV